MERKYAPLICSASENPYSSDELDEFVIYLATEVDAHLAALQAQHAEAMAMFTTENERLAKRITVLYRCCRKCDLGAAENETDWPP